MESEEACSQSSCSEVCAVRKTAAAALFIKGRECSDLVRDDGEYAAAVEDAASCSGGTEGWDRHSALSSAKHKTWSSAKHQIWMASIFSDFPVI